MPKPYYLPAPGTLKTAIPTPALVIDLDLMEENISRMASFFAETPAKLRPHFKTHKCPVIAHKQIQAGAIGMTCAKLGEAEELIEAGIQSVLIANQVVDPIKIKRMAELANQAELIVAVDQAQNLVQISEAALQAGSIVNIVIEIDVGLHRCGVQPGNAALPLAKLASSLGGLHFTGILGYEGHTVLVADTPQRITATQTAMSALTATADTIRQAGYAVEIVSAGGTGTYNLTGAFPGITEVEAGSYPFMDTRYRSLDLPFGCALTLMATVISAHNPGRAIIDAGMKSLTTDNGLPEVLSPSGVKLIALNEEHGHLEIAPGQTQLNVGDRVELIPSHVCTTVNLHDRYYAVRKGILEDTWTISGRGRSQ